MESYIIGLRRNGRVSIWSELFDLKTIFWGGVWALLFAMVPVVMRRWRSLTPVTQYLTMAVLFFSALASGMSAAFWVTSSYLDAVAAFMLVAFPFLSLHMIKDEEGMTFWGKITHKLLVVPFLWREYVTRTCKKCRLYDSSTRNLSVKSGWESAYEPCRRCGSADFEFHKLA